MKKEKFYFILLLSLIVASCATGTKSHNEPPKIKNIIFMIGDGMGDTHLFAAMTQHGNPLFIEQFPFSGFQKTFSLTHYITDSAAGGTALATGHKTKNGVLGQDTLGNNFESILKIAEANGLATGLISTSSLTHATPAAFYCNQPSRKLNEEIAADLLKTDVDLVIGGGYDAFHKRQDGLNLGDSLRARGYTVTQTMDEVRRVKSGKLAGFTAPVDNPKYSEGRGEMLTDAVSKALELLSQNQKGFFLMVEGSMIDWGAHANDLQYVIDETLDFDRAIGKALEFAKKDGNTLIVVTADHETGGMTLTGGNVEKKSVLVKFSTSGHSAGMVPIFSYGPGAEKFSGILDNTEFFGSFMKLYGFTK